MVSMGLHTIMWYVAKEAAKFLNTAYEEFKTTQANATNL